MSALVTKLAQVLEYLANEKAGILSELASTKAALAEALANDVADSETITTALVAAQAARDQLALAQEKIAELQALADADATEDEAIEALLEGVIPPAQPEPELPPAVEEPTPEVEEPAAEGEPVAEEEPIEEEVAPEVEEEFAPEEPVS